MLPNDSELGRRSGWGQPRRPRGPIRTVDLAQRTRRGGAGRPGPPRRWKQLVLRDQGLIVKSRASVRPVLFGGAKPGSRNQYWPSTVTPLTSAGSLPEAMKALKSML
jgi:hypothetical protein